MKILMTLIFLLGFANLGLAEETIGQKTGKAIDNSVAVTKEQKEKDQKEFEKDLAEVKVKIAELKKKSKDTTGSVKADMDTQLKSLEKDEKELHGKVAKMKTSSGQAWDELKAGTSEAFAKASEVP